MNHMFPCLRVLAAEVDDFAVVIVNVDCKFGQNILTLWHVMCQSEFL